MTWTAANAKKRGEERINGEKAEAWRMASKGDDGGHVGSGEAASAHGALWMVVSMNTCEVPRVPCFLFGSGISPLIKDLGATSLGADDVTVVSFPGWLARGAFSARNGRVWGWSPSCWKRLG